MTEERIIDGVNVAGCDYISDLDCSCIFVKNYYGTTTSIRCSQVKNCHYKQLKRLEQENKKLKKDVQLFKCLDTFGESECHCACRCLGNEFCEDADKKINTYRSALEEIQKAIKIYDLTVDNGASVDTLYTIRKIINEVLE